MRDYIKDINILKTTWIINDVELSIDEIIDGTDKLKIFITLLDILKINSHIHILEWHTNSKRNELYVGNMLIGSDSRFVLVTRYPKSMLTHDLKVYSLTLEEIIYLTSKAVLNFEK